MTGTLRLINNYNLERMKTLKLVLAAILALAFITSCEKDENDSKVTLEKETISATWIVNGSGEYKSFEFNESGNYIVVINTTPKSTNSQIILFGTYKIVNKSAIELSDFGTIKVTSIDDTSISFSVMLYSNPDNEIMIDATRQEEMESSTRTDLLSRTWEMVSVNGEPVVGTDMEVTVLFSKAGTYLVAYADPESENGLAQWKWKNIEETQLLYSWRDVPIWEEENFVEVPELTSTRLKIIEDEAIYILKPATYTKSAVIKSSDNKSDRITGSGLFKH